MNVFIVNQKRIILYSIVGFLFVGCVGNGSESNLIMQIPSRHIYRNMTEIVKYDNKYETVLGTFGNSLSKFTKLKYPLLPDINIEIYEIKNETADGKLPLSAQGMLIESISMLTATSGRFFIPKKTMIDNGAITQADDYDKYSRNVSRGLQIEGSIDRSDIIYSKSSSFHGDVSMTHRRHRADFGFETEDKDSIREIALSLRFVNKMDGRTFGTYERYGSATNSIRIAKKTDGSGYGVFLLGSGIGGNGFKTFTPGVHQAIKILIQHSTIQAFGRYFEVPYWHCLDIYEVDKIQKNNMKIDWNKKNMDDKVKAIQLVLNMYGFSIPLDSKDDKIKNLAIKKTELALNSIEKHLGIKGNINDFNYYFNLYNNMPFADFFPKNYNSLITDINIINSGSLPSYQEPKRILPLAPEPTLTNTTTVIHMGDMDVIQNHRNNISVIPKPQSQKKSESNYYDKQKEEIDKLEADLFN